MDLKEFIIKEINRREDFAKVFKEKVPLEEYEQTEIEEDIQEVTISKEVVVDYLVKSGLELTPENFERAQKMLSSMGSNKLKKTLINAGEMKRPQYRIIDHLNDLDIDELNSLLNIAVLDALNSISQIITAQAERVVQYTYAVEVIKDHRGGTNIRKLAETIEHYSSQGYRIASIFTNELWKNSSSISTSIDSFGSNSTVDQLVIIFEKEIVIKKEPD